MIGTISLFFLHITENDRLSKRIEKLEAFQQQTISKEINEIGDAFSREGLSELWK